MDSFCDAVGVSAAIIDPQGEIFVGARWQPICRQFHRAEPRTCARCIESDTILANQLSTDRQSTLYQCRNGLTDAASPIVIDGMHVGNMFIGQFFLEPPDADTFRRQAKEFGFDEAAYLDALFSCADRRQGETPGGAQVHDDLRPTADGDRAGASSREGPRVGAAAASGRAEQSQPGPAPAERGGLESGRGRQRGPGDRRTRSASPAPEG